ncbi:Protein EXORDIUM [Rhynchospora pubera]|uniref:Protein EXORDIUM n=1 Tax=Rhynchospora pubera TaxID=906938 RepID=A0AAV8D0I2_9POAL|nr:Protein EXORDIUM [Rhynchospora pubera]
MSLLNLSKPILFLALLASLASLALGFQSRKLTELYQPQPDLLTYHNGAVLRGNIPISILWYGQFTSAQKAIISDFILSLTANRQAPNPSVAQWWNTIDQFYLSKAVKSNGPKYANILLANQTFDDKCSLGKSLTLSQISQLAAKTGPRKGGIALVFTAQDVTVEGFCMSRCGLHGSNKRNGYSYIWVGNSVTQCPGQCSWPFHKPIYGPQTPALLPPNADVGIDGMVINLASMIAGAVSNPFGDGFYQGPKEAPLEAATSCTGVYGKGAFSGYAGNLLVDTTTGASYNANGAHGRKYLVPALFDPATSTCITLV